MTLGQSPARLIDPATKLWAICGSLLVLFLLVFLISDGLSDVGTPSQQSLLLLSSELPVGITPGQQVFNNDPSVCPFKGATSFDKTMVPKSDGRPYFEEELQTFRSSAIAHEAMSKLTENWTSCTRVTWKLPPEERPAPGLGDESALLFISVDCCPVVDPVAAQQNGDLYAAFVRHGRFVEIVTLITRRESELQAILSVADRKAVLGLKQR